MWNTATGPTRPYLGIQLFGREASVKSLTLTACGGEAISGPASIKLDNLKKPGDVQWRFQTTGSSSSITLTMESPVRLAETESTTFWFGLPPVTLSQGFTINITEADGAQTSITSNKALRVTSMPFIKGLIIKNLSPENEYHTKAIQSFKGSMQAVLHSCPLP